MNRKQALKTLELLPTLLLADVVALETLVKAGDYKGARALAKKLRKTKLFRLNPKKYTTKDLE